MSRWIAKCGRPFSIVCDQDLQAYVEYITKGAFKLPAVETEGTVVAELAGEAKRATRKALEEDKKGRRFHFSCDLIGDVSYIC